ncbi:Ferric reductase transmembrane component-like domain protein [Kalmanozyma brasiliensis GHG001]|uniref:Ferric reductase transmembrane component-like domain protein n=1 Tax=Kalmanozyma brasiliensis (strain GHG001) TaxID=1365824 RepID=UPI0028681442|nr:Ferric reductase transmembrane component-like domain protein [Kalmanozyma brasiliensis GHG001]EST05457.2 Ferric reductase transmembrane component-like domain protein [Kalmanozyma brasiliensis GHG001]
MSSYSPGYSPGVTPGSGSGSDRGCSGSCFDPDQLKYQYLQGYFTAHMLPATSYRYVYLLWFITIAVCLVLGSFHMLGVGERTYIGALWKRWATKNRVYKVGKRVDIHGNPITKDSKGFVRAYAPLAHRQIFTFPSFGRVVLLFFMLAVPIVLTLVGADFISPSVGVFNFAESWPPQTTNMVGLSRRAIQTLHKRVQWGQGSYPSVSTYPPYRTLPYRTWWTSGDRTGDITMGLVPIVLIMALKQVPFALLSTRFFGGYGFDRLSFLHKWGGRIIWLFGTAHLVTWCIQLNVDTRIGEPVWTFVFMWTKFRWGWVSYGFLTAMIVLSIGPIRNRFYEWFYIAHVVTVAGFIITAMLHHPPLAQWMYIPLAWWVAERLTRALKVAWINGLGFAGRKPQFAVTSKPQMSHSQSGNWSEGSQRYMQRPTPPPPHHQQQQQHLQQRPAYYSESFGPQHQQQHQHQQFVPQQQHFISRPHQNGSQHQQMGQDRGDGFYHPADRPPTTLDGSTRGDRTDVSSASSFKYPPQSSRSSENEHTLIGSLADNESRKRSSPPMHDDSFGKQFTTIGAAHPLEEPSESSPERKSMPLERRVTRLSARYDPVNDLLEDYIPSSQPSNADFYPPPPIEALPPLPQQYARHSGADVKYSLQDSFDSAQQQPLSVPGSTYPPLSGRSRNDSSAALAARPSTMFSVMSGSMPRQLRPRPAMSADVAAVIRPGFAFVQLLPGKTLRLTLRTPNKMSWKPGQWVYLNMPNVRFWESHPFTIASAHDADFPVATQFVDADTEKGLAHAQKAKGEERTMVLLVRCRHGFTRQLWNFVAKKRQMQIQAAADAHQGASMYGMPGTAMVPTLGKDTTGVHIRAIVDGPYGSSDRTHWGIHSSIVIICGGSGVSFGMSVLEHLCACMVGAVTLGKGGKGGKKFLTQRVRFVWIVREFSHLQWVAAALRRCIEMVPPEQLQVDLYVTHFNHHSALPQGPRSGSAGGRSHTFSTYKSDVNEYSHHGAPGSISGTTSSADVYSNAARFTEGPEQEEYDITAYDLTHFDGEDQSAPTAVEEEMNKRIRNEGKLRRAKTRRNTVKRKGGRGAKQANVELNRDEQAMEAQRAMYEERHGLRKPQQPYEPEQRPSDGPSLSSRARSHLGAPNYSRPQYAAEQDLADSREGGGRMYGGDGFGGHAWSPEQRDPYRHQGQGAAGDRRHLSPPNSAGLAMPHSPPGSGLGPLSAFASPSPSRPGSANNDLVPPPPFGSASRASTPRMSPSPLGTPYGSEYPLRNSFLDADETDTISRQKAGSSTLNLLNTAVAPAPSPKSPMDDAPIDLDAEEDLDLRVVAELAQPGHPKLDRIIRQEVDRSQGRTLVAGCGPKSLDVVLRSIVSKQIDPTKVRKGDTRGIVNVVSECFEWGG